MIKRSQAAGENRQVFLAVEEKSHSLLKRWKKSEAVKKKKPVPLEKVVAFFFPPAVSIASQLHLFRDAPGSRIRLNFSAETSKLNQERTPINIEISWKKFLLFKHIFI